MNSLVQVNRWRKQVRTFLVCLAGGAMLPLVGLGEAVGNTTPAPLSDLEGTIGPDRPDREKQLLLQRLVQERSERQRQKLMGPDSPVGRAQVKGAVSEVNLKETAVIAVVSRLRVGCDEATLSSLLQMGRSSIPLKYALRTTGGFLVLSSFAIGDGSGIGLAFELDAHGVVVGWSVRPPP